jgi:nicotinate-nucleotide adenylyltransferase
MRLALFGGTFDPIHHGHLILARDAIELLKLDRVIFLPAARSPHKPGSAPASAQIRREMIAAAIAGEPSFEMDDSELHRAGPSYSIETAEEMNRRFPGAHLFFLIGADNVAELHTWRRIDDLRRLVEFAVFDRGNRAAAHGMPSLPRRLDISATEIRRRIARGESIRYFVPEPVCTLIDRYDLYR